MESFCAEDELSSDRELIAVVRVNRFLYDKTEKLYSNGEVKAAAWTQIGASLTHPVEGLVAEKRFYALRQRFGKERRKVEQSMPRSGAGADQPIYTPTWKLYKDLTFLEDIIKPRRTSSNYKSKIQKKISANNQVPQLCTSSSFTSTSAPSNGQQAQTHLVLGIGTYVQDSQVRRLKDSLSGLHSTEKSDTENSIKVSEDSCSPLPFATTPLATLSPTTPSSAVTSGSESNNAVPQVQRAMSKIGTKRKVPPSDSFATKKRQEINAVSKSFIEQSKGLTDFAAKIGEAITAPPPQPSTSSTVVSNASPDIQPMLSAIGFALNAIPKHALL
ncbi:uncharacterized protein LOC115244930 [Formica exsecta]|uniref:uncharacterized protein LOC115244930 n=1 Tax=Formica exsecta TaxID=72781 RepID=UPI0011439C99|nr:uncharacterized protein LOC115244930 [Formica exsecta]